MLTLPVFSQRRFQRASHRRRLPARVCRLDFRLHVWCAALMLVASFASVRAQPANRPASKVTGSGQLVLLSFRDTDNRYYVMMLGSMDAQLREAEKRSVL